MRLQKTKGIAWGVILALAVCSVGCSPTVQKEMAQANNQLRQLQNSNARFYLQDELATIRSTLQEVEGQLQMGNLKRARKEMDSTKKLLSEAKKMYKSRLNKVKQESYTLISYINFYLDSVNTLIQNMPRKTYVDQNRYDIARFRTQKVKKKTQEIQLLISTKDYLNALKKSPQIHKSLNELLQLVEIRPVGLESFKTTVNTPTPQVISQVHASIARAN